jgi:hypothetical protein
MIHRRRRVRRRRQRRRGPARSPKYLAWIRSLRCAVCLRVGSSFLKIEAAHTKALGASGMAQKSSDFSAIPLCFWHHRGDPDSYHELGEHAFAQRHGIDLAELVRRLNEFYRQSRQGALPEGKWNG